VRLAALESRAAVGDDLADARLAQRLRLSPGDEVVRALRRRVVDGEPMALEEIRLPAAIVPGITETDFGPGSLYQRLRDVYRVRPADAMQTTEPTVTDPPESALLGAPLYSPALQFERVTRDDWGRTIELTRSLYRGDRYRLTQHLTFGPESG
jgi:GntR family transcriptional regulator